MEEEKEEEEEEEEVVEKHPEPACPWEIARPTVASDTAARPTARLLPPARREEGRGPLPATGTQRSL